ncbi:MAG: hemerythrin domain-containing protein [Acidovorax sp.]|nr:hemerythrin domain-containing protein [Acidovorax sp.]
MANGIQYNSDLIQDMLEDHRALLAVYGDLVKLANNRDGANFKRKLVEFKSLLVAHLLKEAVKLYIYLRQKLKDDEGVYQLVSAYKSEMDGISRIAMEFVDEYTKKSVYEIDFIQLSSRLKEIGWVLGDRIRREESELYPLYHDFY